MFLEDGRNVRSIVRYKRVISGIVLVAFASLNITPLFAGTLDFASNSPSIRTAPKGNSQEDNLDGYNLANDGTPILLNEGHVNANLQLKNNSLFNNDIKYKPYLEIGGAKYFNQTSSVAGIYDLFIPLLQTDDSLLFGDLRIFDRSGSSFEGNAHFGFRKLFLDTLDNKELFGVYAAFDRKRGESRNWYNQLTLGGEYWHNNWFLGGNIYKTIGRNKDLINQDFSDKPELSISDEGIIISRTTQVYKEYERSLSGLDGEVGYSFSDNLTGYIGGYYFAADGAKTVAGPKLRATYSYSHPRGRFLGIFDGISLEIGAQHDKPRGYSAYIGLKLKVGLTNPSSNINSNLFGFERHMTELVRRDPDIVIGKAKKSKIATETSYITFEDNDAGYFEYLKLLHGSFDNWNNKELAKYHDWLIKKIGLNQAATNEDIKKAKRDFIYKHHPDRCHEESGCNKKEQENIFTERYWPFEELGKINIVLNHRFEFLKTDAKRTTFNQKANQTQQTNIDYSSGLSRDEQEALNVDILDAINQPVVGGDAINMSIHDEENKDQLTRVESPRNHGFWDGFVIKADHLIDQIFDIIMPIKVVAAQIETGGIGEYKLYATEESVGSNWSNKLFAQYCPTVEEIIITLRPESCIERCTLDNVMRVICDDDLNSCVLSEDQQVFLEQIAANVEGEDVSTVLAMIAYVLTDNVIRYNKEPRHLKYLLDWSDDDQLAKSIIISQLYRGLKDLSLKDWSKPEIFSVFLPLLLKDNSKMLMSELTIVGNKYGYIIPEELLDCFQELCREVNIIDRQLVSQFVVATLTSGLYSYKHDNELNKLSKHIYDLKKTLGILPEELLDYVFNIYAYDQIHFTDLVINRLNTDKEIHFEILNDFVIPNDDRSMLMKLDDPVTALFIGLRIAQNHVPLTEEITHYFLDMLITKGDVSEGWFDGFKKYIVRLFSKSKDNVKAIRILAIDIFHELRNQIPASLVKKLVDALIELFPESGVIQQIKIEEILQATEISSNQRKKFAKLNAKAKKEQLKGVVEGDKKKLVKYIDIFAEKKKLSLSDKKLLIGAVDKLTAKTSWSADYLLSLLKKNISAREDLVVELITTLDKAAIYNVSLNEVVDREGLTLFMILDRYILSRKQPVSGFLRAMDRLIRDSNFTAITTLDDLLDEFAKINKDDIDNARLIELIDSGYFKKQIIRIKEIRRLGWLESRYKLIISESPVSQYEEDKLYFYRNGGDYYLATTVGKIVLNGAVDTSVLNQLGNLFSSDNNIEEDDKELIYELADRFKIVPRLRGVTKGFPNWNSVDNGEDVSGFVKWTNNLSPIDYNNEELVAEIIAVVSEVAHETILKKGNKKYYPRDAQLLSLLSLLVQNYLAHDKGIFLQIGTGEGKTLIVAMFNLIKSLEGRAPDIITSSSVLAKRDAEDNKIFYQSLGVNADHNVDINSDLKECYKNSSIIYGDILNFNGDSLRDIDSNIRFGRGFDLVTLDEVDYSGINLIDMKIQLSSELPGIDALNYLLAYMWSMANVINSYLLPHEERDKCYIISNDQAVEDEVLDKKYSLGKNGNKVVFKLKDGEQIPYMVLDESCISVITDYLEKFTKKHLFAFDEHIRRDRSFVVPSHLERFVKDQLPNWIRSLAMAVWHREGVSYVLDERPSEKGDGLLSIVPVDIGNGVLLYNLQWQDGLQQFLQLKHGLAMTSENLVNTFLSYFGYLNRYTHRYGVTGTLGELWHRGFLKRMYNVNLVNIPNFIHKNITYYPAIFVDSDKVWYQTILDNVEQLAYRQDRAVLIVMNTVEEVRNIEQMLNKIGGAKFNVFIYGVEEIRKRDSRVFNVGMALRAHDVIIATNLAGRGTDIKISDEVIERGGLHVISASVAEDSRTLDQIIGRCARQGEPGSAITIGNVEQIKREYFDIKDSCLEKLKVDGKDNNCLYKEYLYKIDEDDLKLSEQFKIPQIVAKDKLFIEFTKVIQELDNPIGYKLVIGKPVSDQAIDDFSMHLYLDDKKVKLIIFGERIDGSDRFKNDLDITELINTIDPYAAKHIKVILSEGKFVDQSKMFFSLSAHDRELIYFVAAYNGYIRNSNIYNRVSLLSYDIPYLASHLEFKVNKNKRIYSTNNDKHITRDEYFKRLLVYEPSFSDLSLELKKGEVVPSDLYQKIKLRDLFSIWLEDRKNYNNYYKIRQAKENFGYFLRKFIDPLEQYNLDIRRDKKIDVVRDANSDQIQEKFSEFMSELHYTFNLPSFIKNTNYEVLRGWHNLRLYYELPTLAKEENFLSGVFTTSFDKELLEKGKGAYSSESLLTEAIDWLKNAEEADDIYAWSKYNLRAYLGVVRGEYIHKQGEIQESSIVNLNFFEATNKAIEGVQYEEIHNPEASLVALIGAGAVNIENDLAVGHLARIAYGEKAIEILTKNHDNAAEAMKNKGIVRTEDIVGEDELAKDLDLSKTMLKIIKENSSVFGYGLETVKAIGNSLDDFGDFYNNTNLSDDQKYQLQQLKEKLEQIRAKEKAVFQKMSSQQLAQGKILMKTSVYKLDPPEKNWFGTIFSAIIGVAFIAVGSLLAPYASGVFANVFVKSMIIKGIGDVISSAVSVIAGEPIDFKEYLKSTAISVGVAIITAGILDFIDSAAGGLKVLNEMAGRADEYGILIEPDFVKDQGMFVAKSFAIQSLTTVAGIGIYDGFLRKMVDYDAIRKDAEKAAEILINNNSEELTKIYASGLERALYDRLARVADNYLERFTNMYANAALSTCANVGGYFVTGAPAAYGFGAMFQTGVNLWQGIVKNFDAIPEMVKDTQGVIDDLAKMALTKSGLLEKKFKSTFKSGDDAVNLFQAINDQWFVSDGEVDCGRVGEVNLKGVKLSRVGDESEDGYKQDIIKLCYKVESRLNSVDLSGFKDRATNLMSDTIFYTQKHGIAKPASDGIANLVISFLNKEIHDEKEKQEQRRRQELAKQLAEVEQKAKESSVIGYDSESGHEGKGKQKPLSGTKQVGDDQLKDPILDVKKTKGSKYYRDENLKRDINRELGRDKKAEDVVKVSPHRVKRGENLWNIAKSKLGPGASRQDIVRFQKEVIDLNKERYPTLATNPNHIQENWVFAVPQDFRLGASGAIIGTEISIDITELSSVDVCKKRSSFDFDHSLSGFKDSKPWLSPGYRILNDDVDETKYAVLARRPLNRMKSEEYKPLLTDIDLLKHHVIYFDEGKIVGYTHNSVVTWQDDSAKDFYSPIMHGGEYEMRFDKNIMEQALQNTQDIWDSEHNPSAYIPYDRYTHNCQHYVDATIEEYKKLGGIIYLKKIPFFHRMYKLPLD